MHGETTARASLIPPCLHRAGAFAVSTLVPQVILLILNIRSWTLIHSGVEDEGRRQAMVLFGYLTGLLVVNGASIVCHAARRKPVPLVLSGLLMALHIGYLWLATPWIDSIIPRADQLWILPGERVLYYQYALIMPAVFHTLLNLACYPIRGRSGREALASLGLVIVIPVGLYIFVHTFVRVLDRVTMDVPTEIIFIILIGLTVLVIGALLRAIAALYRWLSEKGESAIVILTALVAIAAPIGGLLLNIKIPFPSDFQSPAVYALALVNGILLIIPNRTSRLLWFLRAVMFAFTLYFFVVFLPFLPLAIPAMLAIGAGFLVLTPTALFALHLRVLTLGWKEAWAARPRTGIVCGLLAVLVLPGILIGHACLDRYALNQGLDYVYAPDYAEPDAPPSPGRVLRSLESLRNVKEGIRAPFITDLYQAIVFGGLVLTDDKMDHLYRVFGGTKVPEKKRDQVMSSIFGSNRRAFRLSERRLSDPPPTDQVLLTELIRLPDAGHPCHDATVELTMTNTSALQGEFAARISLPPYVHITGFRLDIHGEWVEGRMFERTTALWVYRMIRDAARRDPAVLSYIDDRTLELRVFPFDSHQARRVQLDLAIPEALPASISVGARTLPLQDPPGTPIAAYADTDEGLWLAIPGDMKASLPAAARTPVLHILVDRSAGRSSSLDAREAAVLDMARKAGAVYRVYDVNLETRVHVGGSDRDRLPLRGGFCAERAMAGILAQAPVDPETVPVFILVTDDADGVIPDKHLAAQRWKIPDIPGYVVMNGRGVLSVRGWDGATLSGDRIEPAPVHLFAAGEHRVPVAADDPEGCVVTFPGTPGSLPLTIRREGDDVPLEPMVAIEQDCYRLAAGVRMTETQLTREPYRRNRDLASLVEAGREAGVLTPAVTWMVVERDSQWEILERKEQQKLNNRAELGFMEAPEPSSLLLLAALLALLLYRRRFQTLEN